jgi:hypothetical protein
MAVNTRRPVNEYALALPKLCAYPAIFVVILFYFDRRTLSKRRGSQRKNACNRIELHHQFPAACGKTFAKKAACSMVIRFIDYQIPVKLRLSDDLNGSAGPAYFNLSHAPGRPKANDDARVIRR